MALVLVRPDLLIFNGAEERAPVVSNEMTPPSRRRDPHRHVTFGSVTIRDYPMTLGDNPVCSYGPPVQLDWTYELEDEVAVDEYEKSRPIRRRVHQMVLSHCERCDILTHAGFSSDEIRRAQRECAFVKRQRSKTHILKPANQVQEAIQDAGDKVKTILKRKSRRERRQTATFFAL